MTERITSESLSPGERAVEVRKEVVKAGEIRRTREKFKREAAENNAVTRGEARETSEEPTERALKSLRQALEEGSEKGRD